jgi:hypothetical protein
MPFIFMLTSDYGGEIIYRVYVFSLPWCALIVAGLWDGVVRRPRRYPRHCRQNINRRLQRRRRLTVGLTSVALSLFTLAAFQGTEGQVAFDYVSVDSAAAADYFYDNARPGSALVLATPFFPTRLDASYRLFNQNMATDPAVIDEQRFRHRQLGSSDVPAITEYVDSFVGAGHYLAISQTMAVQAGYFGYLPAGSLDALTDALRRAPEWRVFYENDEVVIFLRKAEG